MKKLNNVTLLLILLFISFGCDDILEEDITDDIVQIISPREGATIEGNTAQFLWQSIEGADGYRVQIIGSNQRQEVDSLVTVLNFTYNLDPGDYQWRIKAENFAYETDYTFPINFEMRPSDDLSNQSVVLQTPTENLYTNNKNIIFTWESLSNADTYTYVLAKKTGGEQTIFEQPDIIKTSFNIDPDKIDEDAEYIWKVKAFNTTSNTSTPFSEHILFIDTVIPNQPTLSEPLDEAKVVPSSITFNWTNGADSGIIKSAITNTLEISTDSNFNTVIHSAKTTNNSAIYEFTTSNTYYWRVKAIDAATNESDYSIVRSIIVEN
ncbi:fibronectin type III domain-containing protein [Flavivirga rizhaonensis]|uniref:Fibronectin type-III domain-containing protein n=1 Tax=Flavivirga rizhaonensis TaxID=2559571 RepID=A0A4V3P4D8_9FLAO|nr:hypothetical protein [Flavivirga rizhaonensis]TGV01064.1 hypothetical protein EM932_17035 [Flavivirga rizhaonensis]